MTIYKCIDAFKTKSGKEYCFGQKISFEEYNSLFFMDRIKFVADGTIPVINFDSVQSSASSKQNN